MVCVCGCVRACVRACVRVQVELVSMDKAAEAICNLHNRQV